MKAEDVMRALRCCAGDIILCQKCAYRYPTCKEEAAKDALALLREKDAEIERLTGICDSYALQYGSAVDKEAFLKQERADTVRKMQERLRKESYPFPCAIGVEYAVPYCKVDQIAKEMVEGNKCSSDVKENCKYNGSDGVELSEEWLPTADVVEVVRCKDCKYCFHVSRPNYERYECEYYGTSDEVVDYVHPTHFCSCGERRATDETP